VEAAAATQLVLPRSRPTGRIRPPAPIIKIPEGAGKEEKFLFMRLKTIKTSHRRDIAIFISGYD
jgi:hypothetical protein